MLGNFSEEAKKLLNSMLAEAVNLNMSAVGSEHLILAYLKSEDPVVDRLNNLGLEYNKFKKELIKIMGKTNKVPSFNFYTPLLIRVIENTVMDSKDRNTAIGPDDLFCNVIYEGEGIAIRIMQEMNLDINAIFKCFEPNGMKPKTRITEETILDEICQDLNEEALNNKIDPVFERDDIISRMAEIFSRRTKNNPLLIGGAGVGKTAIVEGLTRKIVNGEIPSLENSQILGLDMASAVAGTKYRGEFEEKLKGIIQNLENNKTSILFIDEIHTIVGAGGAEGAIDASNILKPALARGKIKCIGATTLDEYKKYIETDSALARRFHPIIIDEPSKETTIKILQGLKPIYENYHSVRIKDNVVTRIVEVADQYIKNRYFPDKAIDILDEVCARKVLNQDNNVNKYTKMQQELKKINKAKTEAILKEDYKLALELKKTWQELNNKLVKHIGSNKKLNITIKDVEETIYDKTKIPLFNNKKYYHNLKKKLKNNIYGQESVVNELINALVKNQLCKDNKPLSFLLKGGKWVGKHTLIDVYQRYVMSDTQIINIEGNEFSDSTSITKLLGANAGYIGYDDANNLASKVKTNNYCLIVINNYEMLHLKLNKYGMKYLRMVVLLTIKIKLLTLVTVPYLLFKKLV